MEKHHDIAIIGAGPIGCYIGGEIAKEGYDVAIFEEHKKIGYPIQCAGLVTPRVFDLADIKKEKIVQNHIYGAKFHSPTNICFTIGGKKLHAYVINRPLLDKAMADKAEKNGAKIYLGCRIDNACRKDKKILLKSKSETISCNLLIGADGVFSKTRKWFGLPESKEFLYGIGGEIETREEIDKKFVEIFSGENIAPEFFAWMIPIDEKKLRIGLCIGEKFKKNILANYFNSFLKKIDKQTGIKNQKIKPTVGGVIPVGLLNKTYSSNVMLVGDAASQVKPLSGGGIYTGLKSAKHCITISKSSLKEKNFTEPILRKYHILWSEDIGREIGIGLILRKIIKKLSDKDIDKIASFFKENEDILKIISEHGDIDYPSRLIKPLLSNPRFLAYLPSIVSKSIF